MDNIVNNGNGNGTGTSNVTSTAIDISADKYNVFMLRYYVTTWSNVVFILSRKEAIAASIKLTNGYYVETFTKFPGEIGYIPIGNSYHNGVLDSDIYHNPDDDIDDFREIVFGHIGFDDDDFKADENTIPDPEFVYLLVRDYFCYGDDGDNVLILSKEAAIKVSEHCPQYVVEIFSKNPEFRKYPQILGYSPTHNYYKNGMLFETDGLEKDMKWYRDYVSKLTDKEKKAETNLLD